MDAALYEETLDSQSSVNPCISKEVLYVQDQNGGSYNGQITFDTSILSNSGAWLAYSEAFLEIPFVCTFSSSGDVAAATNAFLVGLKNGSHHLIDSLQVDYNNTNVIQLQPFTNFYVSYKMMTSFSQDDVKKHGPGLNFCPDTASSFSFEAKSGSNGDGYSNNRVYPLTAPAYTGNAAVFDGFNEGLAQRLKSTAYGVSGTTLTGGYGALPTTNTLASCNQIAKNYATDNAVAGAGRIVQWNIMATIRLKDIADFFDKLPLVKGGFMRIIVNYNSSTTALAAIAEGDTMSVSSITMNSGRTNPIMVTSGAANNPSVGVLDVAADATFTVRCGVRSVSNSFASPPITSCRLYVPAYSLNPVYEEQLLALKPIKEVVYTDIYNYNISNVGASGSFNAILTNGIVNPKYVVVIPYANSSTAASVFATFTGPVYQSPFDSAPATTTPMASLTNFNVQIGGKNVFQQNFNYDFESFMNEVASVNAINGGSTVGLSNGLIGKFEWDNGYRYYIADVSRRIPAEDSVPKSISIQGTNNSGVPLDLVTFIVFERRVKINMMTGALESN